MFYLRVFEAFAKHQVDYAVVGGFALALHGAVRGTIDLDIVISLKESEFKKTEQVLLKLGLSPRIPLKAEEIFRFRDEYIKKRHLIAWSFTNIARPSEIVDIIITHDRSLMKVQKYDLHGVPIYVASVGDLIKMKKQSKRPQDLEDIKALEEIRREKKKS
jgi:hypothetical protein